LKHDLIKFAEFSYKIEKHKKIKLAIVRNLMSDCVRDSMSDSVRDLMSDGIRDMMCDSVDV